MFNMRPNYELSDIEETRGEDRTNKTNENCDNTLMRYFLPEENTRIENDFRRPPSFKMSTIDESLASRAGKVEKMFKKLLKLHNALKKCFWDRQSVNCSGPQVK